MNLPTFAPRGSAEPLMEYASRVLCFLINTECTAVCSDDDLALARYSAVIACASREITAPALDRIVCVSRICDQMLRARAQDAASAPNAATAPPTPPKPNIGPMAPLSPAPIVRPPSGQKVEIAF